MDGSRLLLDQLVISPAVLRSLALELARTYRHLATNSSNQFLATPINVMPSGTETGLMLAIDVGGTNLRVGFIHLLGESKLQRSYDRSWPIGDQFRSEKGGDLFDWIGNCIAQVVAAFVTDHPDSSPLGHVVPLGIAWSFPLIQNAISEALVMQMGKGFHLPTNRNLGDLLLAGYENHRTQSSNEPLPEIRIAAITNDALATYASLAYTEGATLDKHVSMGLIVGTGTNAAIPMKTSDLKPSKIESMKLPAATDEDVDDTIVVNTEWSINGSAPPLHELKLVTRWDEQVDRESGQPGFMPFEYMAGGRFFGELVRLVAVELFTLLEPCTVAELPEALQARGALDTLILSSLIASDMPAASLADKLSTTLPTPKGSAWTWNDSKAQSIHDIAIAVSTRSARMVAAAVVAALTCSGEFAMFDPALARQRRSSTARPQANNERIVAYTGGVISQFPGYLKQCQSAIDSLVEALSPPGFEQHIILREVLNGSVIGAGVLAGTVWNIPQEQRRG